MVADGMIPLMSCTETANSGCDVVTGVDALKIRKAAHKKAQVRLA